MYRIMYIIICYIYDPLPNNYPSKSWLASDCILHNKMSAGNLLSHHSYLQWELIIQMAPFEQIKFVLTKNMQRIRFKNIHFTGLCSVWSQSWNEKTKKTISLLIFLFWFVFLSSTDIVSLGISLETKKPLFSHSICFMFCFRFIWLLK